MRVWLGLAASLVFAASAPARVAADRRPRELYQALANLRVAPTEVYPVKDIRIRRDELRISFDEGKLAFFAPLEGRVTGAVFSGKGRALALPRDPVEKQQLARFLGEPLLDQSFTGAFLRFTDTTAEDLLEQLRASGVQPTTDAAFAEGWNAVAAPSSPWHAQRILLDWLAEKPLPYLYAQLENERLGPFDILMDNRREEQVLLGQVRVVEGVRFYDVWASFPRRGVPRVSWPCTALSYSMETTILPDQTLEGLTTITIRADRAGERMIPLELSRLLQVESVETPAGEPLVFFQNEALNRQEVAARGNDVVLVILPAAQRAGETFALRLRYRGSVISDAGNGVFFVGDRGSWYPHAGGAGNFTPYDLKLRWPRRWRLVATGKKIEEHEDGEFRAARWKSQQPLAVAGFNLGDYASTSVEEKGLSVELFANRQLERELVERLRRLPVPIPPGLPGPGIAPSLSRRFEMPEILPSPAAALKQLGQEIAASVRFYEKLNGPFPYEHLSVSQIPGTFGQGWPGLLYLSTFTFLPRETQERAGVSAAAQEHFQGLVPFHEVAHQWWGNVVGWGSYRDQWIDEAMAGYMALLFADSQKSPGRTLRDWLDRYRARLTEKLPDRDAPADALGPLVLGSRLVSSRSPHGFEPVIYGKGAWVIHMLRMMLRQASLPNPDERFFLLLRRLLEKYRFRALTTDDLQGEVEAVMTPAMDLEGRRSMEWFFDQWVRGTGIPRYKVSFTVRKLDSGYLVHGTLTQTGVPASFLAPVPLYASSGSGKPQALGTVTTTGAQTHFHFATQTPPRRILIDPQLTLLCMRD